MSDESLEQKLAEISKTDFLKLVYQTIDQHQENKQNVTKKYNSVMAKADDGILELYKLLRDEKLYSMEYRIKYYVNMDTAEAMIIPVKKDPVGFQNEDA